MDFPKNSALIVVDMQNDFVDRKGSLYVPGAEEIVPLINRITPMFDCTFWTRDWHPESTSHFDTWPPHCVQNTWGAQFHDALESPSFGFIISKGMRANEDSYSAFDGSTSVSLGFPNFLQVLRDRSIKRLYVCGVATDYCVKFTVLDALHCFPNVIVFEDAIRAVTLTGGQDALRDMRQAGASFFKAAWT